MMQTRSDIASRFQSTLSVRRATGRDVAADRSVTISIHALREESDPYPKSQWLNRQYFNPRSP